MSQGPAPDRARALLELLDEAQERARSVRAEITRLEGVAEGLSQALGILGIEVAGGHSEISGDRLRAALLAVLQEADPYQRGVHYREITELVQGRGWVIRGRDPAANALAHMSPSPRFKALGRGLWTWQG